MTPIGRLETNPQANRLPTRSPTARSPYNPSLLRRGREMANLRLLAAILLAVAALACGGEESDDGADASATPPPSMVPLPETAFRVEWGVPGVPASVPAGSTFAVGVRVKNTGDQAWMDPRNSD